MMLQQRGRGEQRQGAGNHPQSGDHSHSRSLERKQGGRNWQKMWLEKN